jgi:hypothetical protein
VTAIRRRGERADLVAGRVTRERWDERIELDDPELDTIVPSMRNPTAPSNASPSFGNVMSPIVSQFGPIDWSRWRCTPPVARVQGS